MTNRDARPPSGTVTWQAAWARRIARQGLETPGGTPAGVTGAMLGAHAQVMSAAELSVALRVGGGATRADVRAALWQERTLVKTYGPRGTVHLLPAADLPLWTGALSAIPAGGPVMPDGVRMTPEQTDEVVAAIRDALGDGQALTVDELTDAITARTGSWAGDRVMEAFQDKWPRWRQATHTAAHRGVLAFGPVRGRRVTYTSPDVTPLPGPAALEEVVLRYLRAYGPSTPQWFARWLAAPKGWAARLFAEQAAAGRITEVVCDDGPAWVAAGDTAFDAGSGPRGVRLLPYFDAYTIAAQPRERLFPGAAWDRALAGGQAGNYPVVLVDGTVSGVWHQRRSGRRVTVTVEPVGPALASPAAREELAAQAERVGEVLEGRAELVVGEVTVGPHA
ncbi:winged helix DNA-binding domain-containing protein [Streptomyces sp. t39]|uniref:winged helix DNA-binding domain-containing protein n=1 Tax=Streptomyces sp. t39 TaxID=1828156 RepID=UPI0011CE2075|nr:winged helix DNA-binding domain-containing protein [Streptomyces sp. t39]TXS56694.1 winged helix DNA-binding domain-containing protein [Streptomyces sp. t39]